MKQTIATKPAESQTLKTEIVLSQEARVGSRILFVISHEHKWLPSGLNYGAVWLEPFALLVMEKESEYVLSLSDEPVNLEDLLAESPSLKAAVEKSRARA
ncbi:MAG: hypothetical protein M1587_12020 [Thaumarchaeota archaeon]|nr:hypothetical protein [Nitrososphaerota archaeon]MCL5068913.1 hypothetical protein [Nitrososphaerota archaeon]MDG6907140.1 hypothetical protein [Nitrososphaerota archaeon]